MPADEVDESDEGLRLARIHTGRAPDGKGDTSWESWRAKWSLTGRPMLCARADAEFLRLYDSDGTCWSSTPSSLRRSSAQ